MVEIRDVVVKIDSSELYKKLKGQAGVRDFQEDGRTLSVDDLKINFIGCDFVCEDDVPEFIFENL